MPEVKGLDKLFSLSPVGQFGKPQSFGLSMFGFSNFGDSDICIFSYEFGILNFGVSLFADFFELSGIYQRAGCYGKFKLWRKPYFIPPNPRTIPQQTNRQKIADGILAWRDLTTEQKAFYNEKALGKHMSGYNVFLRQFLLS